jgi:HPr kinase/phosphorylase
MSGTGAPLNLHASCVAIDGKGVLVYGASGSGKSALALQLMALGATLVADDRTLLRREDDRLIASAPETIAGVIEARGVGLLQAATVSEADVVLAVDMDRTETNRLPPLRYADFLSLSRPVLHCIERSYFPAAILQYLKSGRRDST